MTERTRYLVWTGDEYWEYGQKYLAEIAAESFATILGHPVAVETKRGHSVCCVVNPGRMKWDSVFHVSSRDANRGS